VAKQRVLIVDDDEAIRSSTAESLARHDREVRTAESATAALAGLDRWRPDVVLSDVRMPGLDGLELLERLGLSAIAHGARHHSTSRSASSASSTP